MSNPTVPPEHSERPRAVSVLIVNGNMEVLAVSRKNDHADLGLPGGSVEPGETFAEASIRETLEEVGIKILKQREVFDHPCRVHYAYTYLVTEYEGEPRSMEGAWVGWVKPERLLEPNCSFREYNLALFKALDML